MVRFSCFQAHIHFHKPKKNVRLSGELMEKTSDDSSVNRNLGNVSCLPTEIKPCSKEDGDSPNTADHTTDSSPTERECISEEIESKHSIDCNFLAHNSIPIRKSQSLGSGLNWVERSSGADDSDGEKEHKLSSDESADRSAVLTPDEINNCDYQLQESVLSDSIRVNSDFAKDTSIFSIGDPQQSEGEHAHQDDLCLSDGYKSDDRTFSIHPIIVKSRSLPTMTSPYRCSASFLQCSRSVEDLHGLECKTNNMLRELGRQVRYPEKDDSVVDNDKVHEENPPDETSETYKYVQSAKDWIMPVLDVVTEEKGFKGETSLYPPDELPPKDFRLKRIEDWVSDLQHYTPLDVSGEYAPFDDTEPSTGKFLLEDLTVMKSEVKVDPGTEAAKKYISSLNASTASAQLTNLGLVTIPILSAFVSLKALNLSGNAIVRITAGALPRGLHTLNLSKNSISTIEGLRDLTRLRVLDLSYNRIVRIGHGLSSCSSLKELYLAGNKVSEVEGLHRLLKLNILDLRFNKISTTKCLGQLAANYSCLQALSLEGNPSQKNVGEEQLRKYVISLLPHLTYYNRKPIKTGTIIKDSSDRSARLGSGTHQVDRGLELKKGKHGVVPSKVSSSSAASLIHGKRGHGTTSQKPSRSKHGPRLPIPSGTRMSGAQGHDQLAAADFGSKMLSLRNDLSIPRSQSDGNLRAF